MGRNSFISLFFALAIISFLTACSGNQDRQIVPYDVDTDAVYQPLTPNEDPNSPDLSFGHDNIPGFVFDYEMNSQNPDVYVFLENFTILDINPEITQDILEFTQQILAEYGFINDSVNLPENEFAGLLQQGLDYKQAAARILDQFKTEFEAQLDTIYQFSTPFNAYLQIYPIYIDNKYVTYRESAYCYTGGAHGMTVSYLKTYDLENGKVMTLDDLIKPESIVEVREEVAAHMAYSYPIYENISTVQQYIDSLNVWLDNFNADDPDYLITIKTFPISDVALVKEGLAVVYQMYELTPGSDGCPLVLIPYKDLKGCLR